MDERCRHQKETEAGLWDSYCIRKKDHEGKHMHKGYSWWVEKGYV